MGREPGDLVRDGRDTKNPPGEGCLYLQYLEEKECSESGDRNSSGSEVGQGRGAYALRPLHSLLTG